jgi:nicotinate-nucleotide pyrophosphorylase
LPKLKYSNLSFCKNYFEALLVTALLDDNLSLSNMEATVCVDVPENYIAVEQSGGLKDQRVIGSTCSQLGVVVVSIPTHFEVDMDLSLT